MQSTRFYILLLLSFYTLLIKAQDSERLDSLLNEIKQPHEDSVKVDILNSIAWEYRNSEMEKVQVFSDSALNLAKKINYYKGQVKSHFNIGNMYYIKGDFSKTLESYLKALSILEKLKDQEGIASALMGIGNIHAIQKDLNKAIEYQEKSLEIRLKIKDSLGIAGSYNNLGSIYMDMKDYEKALEYHFKSLEIKEKLHYWKGMSSSYGNIGVAYKEMGKLEKAIEYQQKALEIRKKLNNMKGMVMSYTDIGNIYYELKQYNKGLEYQKKGLEIAKKCLYKEGEVMALLSLSATSEKLKNYNEALNYYKEYAIQKDSLFSVQKSKEIADLESVHTAEKQKQQIKILEKDNTIQELKIKAQEEQISVERSKQVAIISVLVLVICLVFFLIYTAIKRKKANRLIAEQKELVEEKNKEITDSITYAKRIQDAILPPSKKIKELLPDSFIFYQPKDIVAGDFYWLETISSLEVGLKVDDYHSSNSPQRKNIVLFAAADCTGHGVPGAMVSVVCHNALNRAVKEFKMTDPGKILDVTRNIIIDQLNASDQQTTVMKNIRDGMDIALCSLEQEDEYWKLKYAGANNPLWLLRKGGEEIEEVKATKQAIGRIENPEPYTTHSINLQKGDTIYIFSDGFADQFGGDQGKKFMYKSLKKLLISVKDETMEMQKETIRSTYNNWKGNFDQVDDVCVIGVKI